jgi:hypothetical protein
MKIYRTIPLVAGLLVGMAGTANAKVGDVTPLSRADLGRVEAMLVKAFKGKPTLQGGTKEELEDGWRVNCVAEIGSGGVFDLVVMAEKTMTLGYVEKQMPKSESTKAQIPTASGKDPKK